MKISDPLWLGSFAVLGTSVSVLLNQVRFFGRKLSLEEALSVCWVAWAIYMGVFVIYVGLKLPLSLSRDADVSAVAAAVCISMIAIFCLARLTTNWRTAVTHSIRGLFSLIIVVVGSTHFFR